MNLETRISELESGLRRAQRRNGQLAFLSAGIVAVGAWAVASGLGPAASGGDPKEVRTNRLVIEDKEGVARIEMAVQNGNSIITLLGSDGTTKQSVWAASPAASLLVLQDPKNNCRVDVGAFDNNATLGMFDGGGKSRVGLTLTKHGPTMSLKDANGKPRAVLDSLEEGPALTLFDANGMGRACVGATRTIEEGAVVTLPESSLSLFGKDGRRFWKVP